MKKPSAKEYNLTEILQNKKYYIDDYQREYRWKKRQIKELIQDLTDKYLESYMIGDEVRKVKEYRTYFLGSILISDKDNNEYIVDGQQRITSLSLLLIYIHNLIKEEGKIEEINVLPSLIYSQSFGENAYNIDVEERNECMDVLFKDNEDNFSLEKKGESVINLVDRYRDIKDLFPQEIKECLVNFTWWLISNVFLIKITSFSDNDAYTIFETMNDRGLSLDNTEMLKGYLLANIDTSKRKLANNLWKERVMELNNLGKEECSDFFKNWLRGQYAKTVRKQNKDGGYTPQDFEVIASAYHKWVKENKENLALNNYENFYDFIIKDFDFYSTLYMRIREYENDLIEGYEELYYNSHNNFTGQMMMILGSVKYGDSKEVIDTKIKLVSTFADIFIARNLVNFRVLGYSSVIYKIFNFTKGIRNENVINIKDYLIKELNNLLENFSGMSSYRLHKQNRKKIHYLLARLTDFIEKESGRPSNFKFYINKGKHKPFEIEHILPNTYEKYINYFNSEEDFESTRNKMGNLILLQRGPNQSLGDKAYNEKRNKYMGENLLAQTIAGGCYKSDPNFRRFLEKTKLGYRVHDEFDKATILERNKLYEDTFKLIWNNNKLEELI